MKNNKDPGWSRVAFLSSLVAALFGALYLANDTYILHKVIISKDSLSARLFYLVVGGWIGTSCMLVYNKVVGKRIDKDYPGFNFGTRKTQFLAFISGSIAEVSTFFALWGNQVLDPSLVIALSTLSVLYLSFYDSSKGYIRFRNIVLPVIFVIVGSFLASVEDLSEGHKITLTGIFVLLIGRCGTDATERIICQRGVWNSDAITFNFWRFLWLSIVGTILAFTIAAIRGEINQLVAMRRVFFDALPWVLLTMFFVFFYNTLTQKAMKTGAVSKISTVLSLQITLGVPITLIANRFYPQVFGKIPTDPLVWIIRSAGIGLITIGVISLRTKKLRKMKKMKRKISAW